jgi:hypothetical protein
MACKNCKKKTLSEKEYKKEFNSIDKWSTTAIIIWFLLGMYGLYSVITNVIGMFK